MSSNKANEVEKKNKKTQPTLSAFFSSTKKKSADAASSNESNGALKLSSAKKSSPSKRPIVSSAAPSASKSKKKKSEETSAKKPASPFAASSSPASATRPDSSASVDENAPKLKDSEILKSTSSSVASEEKLTADSEMKGKKRNISDVESDSKPSVSKVSKRKSNVLESSDEEESEEEEKPPPAEESKESEAKEEKKVEQSADANVSKEEKKEEKKIVNAAAVEEEEEEEDEESEDETEEDSSESEVDKEKKKKKPKSSSSTAAVASSKEKKKKVDDRVSYYSAKFHDPVKDAVWEEGKPVPYMALAKVFEKIEEHTGRMRTVELLSDLFRSLIQLNPDELLPAVYLSLNRIAPAYEGLELGIGESLIQKAIANATGKNISRIKEMMEKEGDLGSVAQSARTKQSFIFAPKPLTLKGVFKDLRRLAEMSGTSSQQQKVKLIESLIVSGRECEAKFLVRSVQGKLRIGLAEKSVLAALSRAAVLSPPKGVKQSIEKVRKEGEEKKKAEAAATAASSTAAAASSSSSSAPAGKKKSQKKISASAVSYEKEVEMTVADEIVRTAYSELPSFDRLVEALLSVPLDDLSSKCHLTAGIPVSPMLAQPTRGVSEVLDRLANCAFTCEWKYDGERAQIHYFVKEGKTEPETHIYSRNAEDHTLKYPDVINFLPQHINKNVTSFIVDSEVVAFDQVAQKILPFQQLSTRARKNVDEKSISVSVCLFAFDLLYLNGKSLLREPFARRRELLHENFSSKTGQFEFATAKDLDNVEGIQEFLEESVKGSCEGLMVKTLLKDATYEPSRRSFTWLKLKKDYMEGMGDSCDLVPIGAYFGKGKRTGVYGGYLLACYDEESENYQTVCKIGTGFSDSALTELTERLKRSTLDKPPNYYEFAEQHRPDVFLQPTEVWEVKAADLSISPAHPAAAGLVDESKGIALRFPRFLRLREDKQPEMATTSSQIADMYRAQGLHQAESKNQKPRR